MNSPTLPRHLIPLQASGKDDDLSDSNTENHEFNDEGKFVIVVCDKIIVGSQNAITNLENSMKIAGMPEKKSLILSCKDDKERDFGNLVDADVLSELGLYFVLLLLLLLRLILFKSMLHQYEYSDMIQDKFDTLAIRQYIIYIS